MFGRSRCAICGRRKHVDDVDEAYRDVRGEQAHEPCGYPNRRQRLTSRFSSAKPKEDDVMIGNQSDKPEAQHDNECFSCKGQSRDRATRWDYRAKDLNCRKAETNDKGEPR
jgi:hypothetical protein